MNRLPLLGLASLLALACSKTREPKDASAFAQDTLADREEQAAMAHDQAIAQAAGPRGSGQESPAAREQQTQANRHRERAAEHRAAAQKIRTAEDTACAGIAPEDRATGPFGHAGDVTSVSVIQERPAASLDMHEDERTAGAEIVLRATPAMTAEWLQRNVDCYMARAATGPATPEMANSPLTLRNIDATVSSTGNGFAVSVTSEDPDTVAEIIRRAEALER